MLSRTGDQVARSDAISDAWASNYSSSSSSSSFWDSGVDAFGGRRHITRPARRSGFHHLELHELPEVRQMQDAARRAADAAARGLGVETQQAFMLSLGLRVAHEPGWMAHREIVDVTLEIAGLPQSAHVHRCLVEIENASLRWSFHGTLTIAQDYFVFPLYHSELPLAVNYGGAGRLIVDEVLRGLFHELMYNQSRSRSRVGHV
ncbi:hypothetical protein MRX96_040047 [Rhipicephalus microplus]